MATTTTLSDQQRPTTAALTARDRYRVSVRWPILAITTFLLVLVTADLASYVQATTMMPTMGFIDHQGHLVDHFASLFTSGSWSRPDDMAVWLWRVGR